MRVIHTECAREGGARRECEDQSRLSPAETRHLSPRQIKASFPTSYEVSLQQKKD